MIDPRHGRRIPSGRRLGRALAAVFRQAWERIEPLILAGYTPTVSDLREIIYRVAQPAYAVELLSGYMRTMKSRSRTPIPLRKGMKALRFDQFADPPPFGSSGVPPNAPPVPSVAELPDIPGLKIDWTLFRPEVRIEAERLALNLAGEVAQATRDMIRTQVGEGLQAGESVAEIAKRIKGEAFSPRRAMTIAQTESSRAMHAGQAVAAKELGVTHWTWLASSDACEEVCRPLDGKTVKIGEPFYVWPTGNPSYRVVYHPPAHPHCFCSTLEVMPE